MPKMDWRDIVRYAVPAVALGVASKQGRAGGPALAAFANTQVEAQQRRLQEQRIKAQDARQATLDQLSMDREQRLIDAEKADQDWRRDQAALAEEARKRDRLSRLLGTLKGATKNPDFNKMVNQTGADQYTLTSPEGTMRLPDVLQELGIQPEPGTGTEEGQLPTQYDLSKHVGLQDFDPEKEPTSREFTWEDDKGNTMSQMMTDQERRKMGTLIKNRPKPDLEKPERSSVKLTTDIFGDKVSAITIPRKSGNISMELSRDDVLNLMRREGGYDESTVDQVMRDPQELMYLLGYR